jgi:hypothetical protein
VLAAQALEPGEPDRPLRIKNFAAIRLGHQLLRQDERYWLVFSADETKAGQPWEAVFPETLLPCLARYLEHHRPVLLRGERGTVPANIDALWVSEIATQLELGALGRRIRIHTDRAFGVSLPPHWFRDAAAISHTHTLSLILVICLIVVGISPTRTAAPTRAVKAPPAILGRLPILLMPAPPSPLIESVSRD